jgi:hypothetical protein
MSEKKWNYNWVINKIKNIVKKTKKIAPSNSPQQSATAADAATAATPTIIKKSPDDNGKQLPKCKRHQPNTIINENLLDYKLDLDARIQRFKVIERELILEEKENRLLLLKPLPGNKTPKPIILQHNSNISNTSNTTPSKRKLKSTDCLIPLYDSGTICGYIMKDLLILDEKIGSQSQYGAIYKTTIKNTIPFNIATKVMKANNDNKLETKLMKAITEQIIITKKSKHFAIMYCYSLCDELEKKRANYALANFNEYANNDLEFLLQQKKILEDEELLYNLLIQAFISIGTFHNFTGYIHNDCQWNNFLYFDNTENDDDSDMICYYQYDFDGKLYYLKSSKYNLMIYDFGLSININLNDNDLKNYAKAYYSRIKDRALSWSEELELDRNFNLYRIDELITLITNDYLRILPFFTNSSFSGLKKSFEYLPNDKITKFINTIYDKIHSITITVSDNRHDLLKNILEAILNICIDKFKKKGIFTDELPEGGIIINNSNPFELYNRAKITLPDI